jgi:hypothetical protein
VQWELQRALARTDQRFRHRSRAQSAHFDPLQPSAEEIAGFVSKTGRQRGPPDHFVSDQAGCFTAQVFRRALGRLGAKIEMGLVHYAHFRPHQALGGATPTEIYFGRTPSHLSAIPPPRGGLGEGPMNSPFRVEYFDAERLLPVLVRKAA